MQLKFNRTKSLKDSLLQKLLKLIVFVGFFVVIVFLMEKINFYARKYLIKQKLGTSETSSVFYKSILNNHFTLSKCRNETGNIIRDHSHNDISSITWVSNHQPILVDPGRNSYDKRFQIKDRGYIREGYYADLAILDLNNPYQVSKENILYKCGWSPFEGHKFNSSIFMTIVNGNIAFKDGVVSENLPLGMQIEFNR